MLARIMKYEFRSANRLLIPFFAFALISSLVSRFILFISEYMWEPIAIILSALASSYGLILLWCIPVLTFVFSIVRFYQSMVSNEAYLHFTLPVGIDALLISRLLTSTIYILISAIVAIICGFIFVPEAHLIFITPFNTSSFDFLGTSINQNISLATLPPDIIASGIGYVVFIIILSSIISLLYTYLAIALGGRLFKNRIVGSVVAYFVIGQIQNLLNVPLVATLSTFLTNNSYLIMNYIENLIERNPLDTLRNFLTMFWAYGLILGFVSLAPIAIHYLITRYLFTKQLNLE